MQSAADIARDMIMHQGMGDKLRDQVFKVDEGMMLDRLTHERDYSEETARAIDKEVEDLITQAASRARTVIKANLKYLEALKDALLEKETVDADEVAQILDGSSLPAAAKLY